MNIADKAAILSDFWAGYRGDPEWQDFMQYNDLGLPLAESIAGGLVLELTPAGEDMINETYILLCNRVGIDTEENFDDPSDFFERL